MKPVMLDHFDIRILAILQTDNLTSQRRIGAAVNLSAAAVQRRIKRMQEAKVITANIAVPDPLLTGGFITLLVEVSLESERADLIDKAKKTFAETPEVQQCYYVTGEIDFMLVIVVPTMTAYEQLTRQLFFSDHNVRRFSTFVVMDRVKTGLAMPLELNSRNDGGRKMPEKLKAGKP